MTGYNRLGVPVIRRESWAICVWPGTVVIPRRAWTVGYPHSDVCTYSECESTVSEMFNTWAEALAFALARSWAQ